MNFKIYSKLIENSGHVYCVPLFYCYLFAVTCFAVVSFAVICSTVFREGPEVYSEFLREVRFCQPVRK